LELPPAERLAYLDGACAGDAALRQQVEGLLRAHEQAGTFLETSPASLALASTPLTEKPGDRIGRYKLLQQIGEGGCGVVYMAEQEEPVRRRVALKIIKLGMDTKQVVARFEAERQALAMMDHPNIAKVLDAGATETGRPFFVMELVRGVPITVYCDENNIPMQQRLELFIQVCQAVQHAHQKGIIHRDIKPSNILVTVNDGLPVPKVIDFGIAKATTGQQLTDKTLFTAFEQFIGTPAYMSPEQAVMTSLDIDTRSDLYSLGVLLYELLTGKTPFDPKELLQAGFDEMRRTIREQEPAKPSTRLSAMLEGELTTTAKHRHMEPPKLIHLVRGDLDWIVMKCLEKDRTRRYETANSLAMDIKRYLNCEPVVARPPSKLYEFQKTVRRHKFGFAACAAIIVVLAAGVIVSTLEFFKEKQARQRAVAAEQEQARLRQEAEAARANEASLRLQAEADEKKAQTEAAKSRQVAQFLEDMLQGVGPSVALGRDTTMLREILDKTAERVGKDLKDQPEVEAELRNTIGDVYHALGEYEKAEVILRVALAMRRKLLGLEHPEVASSLYSLGCVLYSEWKLAEAESTQREALAIRRKLYGQTHLDVATSLNDLGLVLRREAKLEEAQPLLRQALTMRRQMLGNEHPDVLNSLDGLAWLLFLQNKVTEAEAMMREELAIAKRLYGNEHPAVATALNNLGTVLHNQGKLAEAEELLREALAMNRRLQGNEHPEEIATLGNLGGVLRSQGRFTEAEPIFREALAIRKKVSGNEDIRVSRPLEDLADVLWRQGKLAEGEALARESLGIRENQQPGNWETFNCRSLLGGLLLDQKKHAEAEPLLVSGYEGMKQREKSIPFRWKARLKNALDLLVQLYEATGRPDRAAEWKQKLAEFDKAETEKKAAAPQP
jgi:eukaryotic-like serine/threonine-protein kinase